MTEMLRCENERTESIGFLLENEAAPTWATPVEPKKFLIIQVLPNDGLLIQKQCDTLAAVEDYLADVLELYGSTESFWVYEQF